MIDGLVGQCGEHLANLWKRDDGGTGQYPPPTLHVSRNLLYRLSAESFRVLFRKNRFFYFLDPQALLDIYLLDDIDEAAKHAIVSLSGAMWIASPIASTLLIKVIELYFPYEP